MGLNLQSDSLDTMTMTSEEVQEGAEMGLVFADFVAEPKVAATTWLELMLAENDLHSSCSR